MAAARKVFSVSWFSVRVFDRGLYIGEEAAQRVKGDHTIGWRGPAPPRHPIIWGPQGPLRGSRTNDTSSGEVKEVVMPSTALDLATSKSGVDKATTLATPSAETQEPIASSSAAPMVLGEGYDLSNLLTFDPEFIEPSAKASEESGHNATHGQLQQLKALLSSSIETLVEDTEGIKSILEDLQPHLPVTLQELEDLEERVRVTKQLIQDKEALIARSHEEAEGLKAELKTDLAEIRTLNKQLVTGQDEDDEAEIAEVDHVRASALCALEAFLQ
ncbi:hypothetical protein QYE76_003351 [Lolium multiflorum]|uniref:Uncharacterized protein n=1 Tax=Lolium multiflorum TaxID=4521 RepID=A0AAD8RSD4_LOLMU|nr:hypothetical protein QYE76_003351 [Lolium multiflorum]